MAAKPVDFHEDADAEYDQTLDWYLERSKRAALDFAEELNRAVEMIRDAPHRWASGLHDTRRFFLRRFPFALIYRELPSVIQVLALAHQSSRSGTAASLLGEKAAQPVGGMPETGYGANRDRALQMYRARKARRLPADVTIVVNCRPSLSILAPKPIVSVQLRSVVGTYTNRSTAIAWT